MKNIKKKGELIVKLKEIKNFKTQKLLKYFNGANKRYVAGGERERKKTFLHPSSYTDYFYKLTN